MNFKFVQRDMEPTQCGNDMYVSYCLVTSFTLITNFFNSKATKVLVMNEVDKMFYDIFILDFP